MESARSMPEKSDPVLAPVPLQMSRIWAEPGVVVEVEWFVSVRGAQMTSPVTSPATCGVCRLLVGTRRAPSGEGEMGAPGGSLPTEYGSTSSSYTPPELEISNE